jgi:protein ImuB
VNALREGLNALGYGASMACAPTPLAAQWFARADLALRLRHLDALQTSLPGLPLDVMQTQSETLEFLQKRGRPDDR